MPEKELDFEQEEDKVNNILKMIAYQIKPFWINQINEFILFLFIITLITHLKLDML